MIGVIKDWLFSQFGTNFNLDNLVENNIFRDGCLLSDILKRYGLLNSNYSLNITKENDEEKCRSNLKMLEPVFIMLKVSYDDKVISNIVNNSQASILKLLYELYVCLENKQNLYFITQLNHDRVQQNLVKCLKQHKISVNPANNDEDHDLLCFDKPLIEKHDIVQWYKNQYEAVQNNLKLRLSEIKEKIQVSPKKREISLEKRKICPCTCSGGRTASQEAAPLPDLEFNIKSNNQENILSYDQYIASFKEKQQRRSIKVSLQKSIQKELIHKTWSKVMEKQNEIYNSVFTSILLKQSQYEKQLLTKLIQNQQQMKIQNDNRTETTKKVLLEDDKQTKNIDFQLKQEFEELENIYENEKVRVLELHKKLYKEKQNIIKSRHYSLCKDVLESLVDIAVNTSEYQSKYGVPVPKLLCDDWKQLFFKSQPVLIPFLKLEDEVLSNENVDYDYLIDFEKKHSEIITENDVEEYLYNCGRWFYEDVCIKYGNISQALLAFIINRLLSIKYPPKPPPLPADLPRFNVSGVMLNFHGPEECIEKLNILLSKQQIHVFNPETAIKKSITLFVKETQPVEEEKSKQKVSKDTKKSKKSKRGSSIGSKKSKKEVGKNNTGKNKGEKNKRKSKEDKFVDETTEEKGTNLIDKETQTSIVKEDDTQKVERTGLGLVGEEVFKILKDGHQVEDKLLVNIIVEYLKSLGNEINGWVLVNYPLTLGQAFFIELALSGKYLPINDYGLDEYLTMDDAKDDENADKRISKLHPAPLDKNAASKFETYFSTLIKLKSENGFSNEIPSNKDFNDSFSQSVTGKESLINSTTNNQENEGLLIDLLEKFYKEQGIYSELSYEAFDLTTLKKLARAVLKRDGIENSSSVELFGEEALNKLTKSKKKDKQGKTSTPKMKDKSGGKNKQNKDGSSSKIKKNSLGFEEVLTDNNGPTDEKIVSSKDELKKLSSEDLQPKVKNPDDEEWECVSLPIANDVGVILASAWENIENCYLQNLEHICFENRIISLRLVPYCAYVQKRVEEVADTPDIRQDLVNIFKNFYSSFTDKLHALPEVKSQLFCKVLEMQQIIWQIIDKKKNDVEDKRQAIIRENWLVNELCMLINNYLSMVQTEFNRSLETLKLVNDYYLTMLGKTPPIGLNVDSTLLHSNITKITAEDLLVESNNKYSKPNHIVKTSLGSNGVSTQSEITSNFITLNLIDCYDNEMGLKLYVYILKEIEHANTNIQTLSHSFYSQIKTEMNLMASASKKSEKLNTVGSKKLQSKANTESSPKKKALGTDITGRSLHEKLDDSLKNIQTLKLSNIENNEIAENSEKERAFKEWKFVVDTVLQRFEFRMELLSSRAQEHIMEFYCYTESIFCDIHSSNIAKYDADIDSTNKLCDYLRTAIEEEASLENTIVLKRSDFFVYTSRDSERKSKDVFVNELLEQTHDCFFTVSQLNKLMNIFKIAGPYGVIRKQPFCYILQDLMLYNSDDNQPHLPKTWNLLTETQLQNVADSMFGPEYAVNWRDFIVYNLGVPYPTIEDILSMRREFLYFDEENAELVSVNTYENIVLWFEKDLPESPQEGLRIALIKNLLCELFQVDNDKVNYTALLLYFCKDYDPALGLRKALCLALGKNVITSEEEFNELVREEIKIKESVVNLLDSIINTIVQNREGVLIYEVLGSTSDLDLNPYNLEAIYTVNDESRSLTSSSVTDEDVLGSNELKDDSQRQSKNSLSLSKHTLTDKLTYDRPWVSSIPIYAVINVLNASFLHQDKTFSLRNQYLNYLEEKADNDGVIEGHALMRLECIQELFTLTNKFKIAIPCEILRECLNELPL